MMKKILIIGLVLVPLVGYGQSRVGKKISNMTSTSTVNSDAVIPVVQNGANYKTTKSNLQKEVVSTAATNTSNITQLTNNTSGITGFTMTTDGDTVIITYGDESWKLLAVGVEEEDTTPPTVTAVEVGNLSSDTVVVTMSEAMDTGSSNSSFTFTEDGNAYGIGTPIFYSNDTIKIPLDSVAEAEKDYLLSYSRPGVDDYQDVAGNKLSSFTNFSVVNNVASASSIYAYMLFENTDDDEMGAMTFAWNGTESYRTDNSPPQGTYSTSTSAGGSMSSNETHDLENLWTFAGWFNGGNNSNTDPRYLLELDEADIWFDYTNGAQYLEGTINGQSFQSELISDATAEYKWTHMAVTYDGVNGYARTYINGVNVSSDSVVGTYADANGIVDIAWSGSAYKFYGDYDDIHFYKAVLTDAQVSTLYNNPGVPVGGKTDPPIPSDSIEVLFAENWDDFSYTSVHSAPIPVGIPKDSLAAHFTNYESLGSDDAVNPDLADNADIVVFDGSNALKSWFLEGQCCSGAASDVSVSNGGTGIDLYGYITSDQAYYSGDLYLSWNFYADPDFVASVAIKQPGLITEKTFLGNEAASRLMFGTYLEENFRTRYYTTAFWTRNADGSYTSPTWSNPVSYRTNAKLNVIPVGQWVNITVRIVVGTYQGVNGRVEVFLDGQYIGEGVGSVPFLNTSSISKSGWQMLEIATFMGGDSEDYTSTRDQWTIHDEVVIFRFADGADVPTGSTPSASDRDISGTLRSITELNFPR